MNRMSYVAHRGIQLLFADYSNNQPEEMIKAFSELGEILKEADENAVLLLEDVSNVRFNQDVVNVRKQLLMQYKNKLKKVAMVGVEGLKAIVHDDVQERVDIKLPTFETLDEAKDWLVKDEVEHPANMSREGNNAI